ncbi:TPA: ATP-binding protein, partial [Clostridioides difficile]
YMMEVYALVGSSGTGKSFKALEFAYENDIEYIIDDGILIYKNKVLAGISAKQANTTIEAVKRAIFYNLEHRQEVREAIKKENIRKILIIGTSKKMVNQIVERLSIGRVCKFINIQDISTKYEIEIAKQARKEGNHVIPVPAVEIKSMASGLSINSLKRLFRKGSNRNMVVLEKTIIRPTFSYIGKFYISADVIKQIIEYEVYNFGSIDRINKINIENCNNFMNIFVSININDLETIKKIEDIQQTIKKSIEKMTLVNVQKIDINIHKIKKINFLQC